MTELKELIVKRSSIKGRVTKFKNQLDVLINSDSYDPMEISKLSLKLANFQSMFSDYNELQSKIEVSNKDNLESELSERENLEQEFYHCIATARNIIDAIDDNKSDKAGSVRSVARAPRECPQLSQSSCHHEESMMGFRLPTIEIAKFDGMYYKWVEFRDTFQSLIHENPRIKNINKFHYLNTYLEGDAARVISNLEVSDKTYLEAWSLLCQRYNNKRQLINNHLNSLFNIEPISRESDRSLRFLVDHITKNLRALNTLGQPTEKWDTLILHLAQSKLDHYTRIKWEEHRSDLSDMPTLKEFYTFVENRADVLETIFRSKIDRNNLSKKSNFMPNTQQSKYEKPNNTKSFLASANESKSKMPTCNFCRGQHRNYECSVFKSKPIEERLTLVASLLLCQNCLRTGHDAKRCRLPGGCKVCHERHNSLVHPPNHSADANTGDAQRDSIAFTASCSNDVLLSTAIVNLINPTTNQYVKTRCLLDSGSQSTFITDNLKRKLKLPSQPVKSNIVGIGNLPLNCQVERCSVVLKSTTTNFETKVSCLVIPEISDKIPKAKIDVSRFDLKSFSLADPTFFNPSEIDMLIGADLFWDLIGNEKHSLGDNNPILKNSKLGWLIAGPICSNNSAANAPRIQCNFVKLDDLNSQMTKFWELDNFPQDTQSLPNNESFCERHFKENTHRLANGQFCVKLPLIKEADCLGDTYKISKARFYNLERRFRKEPETKKQYAQFIQEYKDLDHLQVLKRAIPKLSFFLPHHPVIRQKSESTRLRVVFNASAKSTTGLSVNDLQMVGPVVQNSIFNILVRFRQHRFVLCGDIDKFYRRVVLHEDDRNLQLILWRDDESMPLTTLQLKTVTYGFSSASFLSTRCLWQLGEECLSNPRVKEIIQNDFYVDDLITGADEERELRSIKKEVTEVLASGGFPLRKFRSNVESVLQPESTDQKNESLLISKSDSSLGLGWNSISDELHFPIKVNLNEKPTKRNILSSTFKIFDPLGLLCLCTILPKIIIQQLWALKIDWDSPIPKELQSKWHRFLIKVSQLSSFKIPRHILVTNPRLVEMHTFCDASQKAYAACIYLKSVDSQGNVAVNLLCAKARVAPIKATSIPRLELSGALLAAQLASAVSKALRCDIHRLFFWTDSSVVLSWLKMESCKLKIFVANRVNNILELTDVSSWRHVPTTLNPADLASRGVEPDQVISSTSWWHGPNFLTQPESTWPTLENKTTQDLPEIKTLTSIIKDPNPIIEFKRHSSLKTLKHVVAYVLRFIQNCKNPKFKCTGTLQVHELEDSLKQLVKFSQNEFFSSEINQILKNKPLQSNYSIQSLNPFVDSQGILRVGGRLDRSAYSFDKKHPMLLHSKHPLTKLIFRDVHFRLLHAGPQAMLASVREVFWPLRGRDAARQTFKNCILCQKIRGKTLTNLMGSLPPPRLMPDLPYTVTGLDFAGPFYIVNRRGRGCRIIKCYLCIFICFRFKCVHLEAVSDLSKDAFLMTLRRFISRRGRPYEIYCDNGKNFVAAEKEINNFLKSNSESLSNFSSNEGIKFNFSPAYAPHHGGYWESAVKAAKHHVKRIMGNSHLTFEEISSLFAQVEAVLNSRPLCPLSPDPSDLEPLTPGHFLIGRALTSLPTPDLRAYNPDRLDRYRKLEQLKQHFWQRWQREYVAEIQQRTKWQKRRKDLKEDDLVLIKEDDAPPLKWRMGRVDKIYPGDDGVPRVADIRTAKGTIRRALNRICLLPLDEA